jgi:hypothetical protein
MTTENPPLEPWQIEHIRKMKAGLPAASDVEEDTMDEELGALNAVADADAEDVVDDAEGADLSVYKDPNVQASVTRRNKLAEDYKKYYDDLTAKIMAQRTGPSFSERMYQLSAAFASPTSTRGFGGVMSNIMPVLQEQAKARREGVNKRQDALSALAAAQLGQRAGLANQDVTTALAMAKLAKQGVGTGRTYDAPRGVWVDKNNPRPTENSYTDPTTKRTFVKWQDGYWREKQPNGGYKVFEREGEDWVEIGIEGAR